MPVTYDTYYFLLAVWFFYLSWPLLAGLQYLLETCSCRSIFWSVRPVLAFRSFHISEPSCITSAGSATDLCKLCCLPMPALSSE